MFRGFLEHRGRIVSLGLPALVSQASYAAWSILTLLLARVLPSGQYAAFSLAKTIELFAVVIGGGFVMQALLKFASEAGSADRPDTVNSAAVLSAVLTAGGTVLLLAGGPLLESFYSDIPLSGLPGVLALLVASEGLCAIPKNSLLARGRTGAVMRADLAAFAVRTAIVLCMVGSGSLHTPHGIFLAQTVSNCVCLAVLMIHGASPWERGGRVTAKGMGRVWRFSLFTLGTSLAAYVYTSTDMLMLGRMAPGDVAGYGIARSLTMFVVVFNQAANIILLPLASRMQSSGRTAGVRARTWQGIALVELVQLPVVALFAVFPRQILDLLFDGRYTHAWPVVTILALLNIARPLGSLFSATASGLGRPQYSLLSVLLTAAVNVGLNAILIPLHGGVGAALATVVSATAGGAGIFLLVERYLRTGDRQGLEASHGARRT